MKSFLLGLALILTVGVFAQSPLEFKQTKHSFGKIKQGVPVTTTFTFTNKGTKPVVIETANADCGCTSPEYPKGAIAKGKTGTIKVTYNAASPGTFSKRVTVKLAGVTEPIVLTIDGEVATTATAEAKAPAQNNAKRNPKLVAQ